jgi:pimeloyl-ACP methyl ester carboxylesterase
VPLLRIFCLLMCLTISAGAQSDTPVPAMPGKLVVVDGHRVHVYCTGQGSPAVIIAGGGFSVDWGLVQPPIARFTRVCTYDPAGMAWSDELKGHLKPSCAERVNELHSLLRNAPIQAPWVLVGYSIGGLVTRLYANQYPADTVGMVLVDHAFVDAGKNSPPLSANAPSSEGDSPPVLIFQTPIALDMKDDHNFSKLPPRDQEAHRWALAISSARPTGEMASEYSVAVQKAEGSRPYPLGNKPLTVISTLNDSPKYLELQHKLLALSSNSQQLIAENSTHMVNVDEPEIIAQAIQEIVRAVREEGTTRVH